MPQPELRPKIGSAAMCERNGWQAGDTLEGDEGHGPQRIIITAIGENNILARRVPVGDEAIHPFENMWELGHRDWRKIEESESCFEK